MQRAEFAEKYAACRKQAWPLVLALGLLVPFGISGSFVLSYRWADQLQADSIRMAIVPVLLFVVCLLIVIGGPFLLLHYHYRRFGLTCPRCSRWAVNARFPSYVLRHGRCPRCNQQILEPNALRVPTEAGRAKGPVRAPGLHKPPGL